MIDSTFRFTLLSLIVWTTFPPLRSWKKRIHFSYPNRETWWCKMCKESRNLFGKNGFAITSMVLCDWLSWHLQLTVKRRNMLISDKRRSIFWKKPNVSRIDYKRQWQWQWPYWWNHRRTWVHRHHERRELVVVIDDKIEGLVSWSMHY